jgi:hypothetical protein
MGHVFMGRRAELTAPRAKERMAALNHANRSHVQVRTLDAFASFAYSMLTANITHFPARARTDSELRSGLPSSLLGYIGSPMGRSKQFIDDRLAGRDLRESNEDPKEVPAFVNRSVIRSRSRRAPRSTTC